MTTAEGVESYADLPDRDVLVRISDRWSVAVMRVLQCHGPQRYGQLRRRLRGVSHKMLTQTLRAIERDGMVERSVISQMPLHVEYRATALGLSSLGPIDELCDWSREHMHEVREARRRYDERETG